MKTPVLFLLIFVSIQCFSQRRPVAPPLASQPTTLSPNAHVMYAQAYDAKRLPRPPLYPFGQDSLARFYFNHFTGIDSVLTQAIDHGDTATYIRIYFSFVVDKDGSPLDGHFLHVTSTGYAKSTSARIIRHFDDDKDYYEEVVKKMIKKMGFWKPGLANLANLGSMIAVDSRVEDYIQFWVGINPPQN